jgi:hypothetical protein
VLPGRLRDHQPHCLRRCSGMFFSVLFMNKKVFLFIININLI